VSKRRTDDEVTRLLKDADRDLAKGLTVSDFCRKVGVAQTTYHRWRKRHDPAQVDSDRRCRQLEVEVERLKRLVAELLLDKQMLQDVAKKKWRPPTSNEPPLSIWPSDTRSPRGGPAG
jgi:putative transposase